MASLRCDHCLGEVLPCEAVVEDDGKQTMTFCCPACQSIYHLIRDEGLDRFYREREGWQPGPPDINRPSASDFQIRKEGDESETDIILSGLRCSSCVWLIEKFLGRIGGIISVRVNYATHKARIRWHSGVTSLDTILNRITALGYSPAPYVTGVREENLGRERKSLLIRLATSAFFTFQIMLLSIALYEGYFRGIDPWTRYVIGFVLWGLATPVVFYGGFPFMRNTLLGLRAGAVSMDTLVFLGSMSAYFYSIFSLTRNGEVYFDTASMIITLILLGRFLEAGARQKASAAISALMGLQPAEARAVRQTGTGRDTVIKTAVASLAEGDLVEVLPGGTIPLDCEVLSGESEVDESMLTGEPIPVFKKKGMEVFSGTSNLSGRLLLAIKRARDETVLSGIIRAVEEAQILKAPVERLADKVTVWFVPAMLVAAAATFFYWRSNGPDVTTALMNGISVLVIACPCALGLATPMAILTGTSRASKKGLLIRGGEVLETLAGIDTVAFDKTGTITVGKPTLTEVICYTETEAEVLRTAASLERYSEHTIARAIMEAAGNKNLYPVLHFRIVSGKGVESIVNGQAALLGSSRFLKDRGVSVDSGQEKDFLRLSAAGGTVVGLALDNKLMGWLCINDNLRSEAGEVIQALKQSGYGVVLLTGDTGSAAAGMAHEAGIAEIDIYAEATPVEKAGIIRQLKSQGLHVLMVGDGINDAPALTEADAGAAMGRATDVTIKSAGAVLMREDLKLIPELLKISHKTFITIKQNLFWAFSYNIVALPLAATGKIHPILSAGLMAASSLLVVGNSLRLRK